MLAANIFTMARMQGALAVRWGLGLVLGLALGAVALVGLAWAYRAAVSDDATVRISGAEVSAHGGVRILVSRQAGTIAQSCNGRCDDLGTARIVSQQNNLREVRVLNGQGECVACVRNRGHMRRGQQADWLIGGAQDLQVTRAIRATSR